MKQILLRTIAIVAALTAACAPPQIDTASLPDGVVGVRYSGQLQAESGTPPYTWQLSEVPDELDWLKLVPETGDLGGIPVAPVSPGAKFKVKVTDHLGRASTKEVTLSVVRATPKVLVSGSEVGGIAANEYAVVWSNKSDRTLLMTSLYGDYTQMLASNTVAEPRNIVTNMKTTYWIPVVSDGETMGWISNIDNDRWLPNYTKIAHADGARGLGSYGDTLYVEHRYGLLYCPNSDCARADHVMRHADASGAPFAVDETGVYVDNTGEYGAIYHNGEPLLHYRYSGAMAAASGVLYISGYDSVIYSCPATGCSSTPKPFAIGGAKLMKADKNGLYWITDTGVFMCPLPDCAGGTRAIAVDQPNPIDLAITGDYVIWANGGVAGTSNSGAIMQLAR